MIEYVKLNAHELAYALLKHPKDSQVLIVSEDEQGRRSKLEGQIFVTKDESDKVFELDDGLRQKTAIRIFEIITVREGEAVAKRRV